MRMMSKALLAGLATIGLAGGAAAAERAVHVLNVAMPDGSIAKVRYVGDTPPRVIAVPVAIRTVPVAMIDPSFIAMDRMMAAMDARADAMMRHAAMLARTAPDRMAKVDTASLPAGTVSYSYVSTTSSNGCTQTVRMTSTGTDAEPKVIRTSAGQCDKATLAPAVVEDAAPAKPATPAAAKPKAPDPNLI